LASTPRLANSRVSFVAAMVEVAKPVAQTITTLTILFKCTSFLYILD
jgi:hypothetical protein